MSLTDRTKIVQLVGNRVGAKARLLDREWHVQEVEEVYVAAA